MDRHRTHLLSYGAARRWGWVGARHDAPLGQCLSDVHTHRQEAPLSALHTRQVCNLLQVLGAVVPYKTSPAWWSKHLGWACTHPWWAGGRSRQAWQAKRHPMSKNSSLYHAPHSGSALARHWTLKAQAACARCAGVRPPHPQQRKASAQQLHPPRHVLKFRVHLR